MQRDLGYLRDLMLEFEESEEWVHFIWVDEDDPESAKKYYHALLLADAGALAVSGPAMDHFRIRDQGYTLISAMRDERAWPRLRKAAEAAGARGIGMLMTAAETIVLAKMKGLLGLD